MAAFSPKRKHDQLPANVKLFLDCNHKPVITDPNDAIWNRVNGDRNKLSSTKWEKTGGLSMATSYCLQRFASRSFSSSLYRTVRDRPGRVEVGREAAFRLARIERPDLRVSDDDLCL